MIQVTGMIQATGMMQATGMARVTAEDQRMPERLFLEDLLVGQRFVSAAREVLAAEIAEFAARYDPQPFHLDDAAAMGTLFGGLAASGWHTAAMTMRMVLDSVPMAGGIIGTGGELAWPRPTWPGDVLQVETEVLEIIPSRSPPERGMVVVPCTTLNQQGEAVQIFTPNLVVPRRPAS
jgi:acyl dehydratase